MDKEYNMRLLAMLLFTKLNESFYKLLPWHLKLKSKLGLLRGVNNET